MPGYFGGMSGQMPPWMMGGMAGGMPGGMPGNPGMPSPLGMPGQGAAPQIQVERNANMTNTPAVQMPQQDQSQQQGQDPLAGLAGLIGGAGAGAAGGGAGGLAGLLGGGLGGMAAGGGGGAAGVGGALGGGGIMGLVNAFKQAKIPDTPQVTPQIMGSQQSMAQNGAPQQGQQPYSPYPQTGHGFGDFGAGSQQMDPSMFMRLLRMGGFGGQ